MVKDIYIKKIDYFLNKNMKNVRFTFIPFNQIFYFILLLLFS